MVQWLSLKVPMIPVVVSAEVDSGFCWMIEADAYWQASARERQVAWL